MEKQIFKKGDRVFDVLWGWGIVTDIFVSGLYSVKVNFDSTKKTIFFTKDGKYEHTDLTPRLSFTKYDLINGGFSQEKPINYDDYIGKWGKFWAVIKDVGIQNTVIGHLSDYNENDIEGFPFACEETGGYYTNFEPLTEKQIKILEL